MGRRRVEGWRQPVTQTWELKLLSQSRIRVLRKLNLQSYYYCWDGKGAGNCAERRHNMVLVSNHKLQNTAPFMAERALAAFGHQSETSSLNIAELLVSCQEFLEVWKRSSLSQQEKERPSSQVPATQTLCAKGRALLSVPRTVMGGREFGFVLHEQSGCCICLKFLLK